MYKPWEEGKLYKPGDRTTPPVRPRLRYGETPQVGDIPRIGSRPGDHRCSDITGITPCSYCVAEKVMHYSNDGRKVMPGLSPGDLAAKDWFTGMPYHHPHPFQAPTADMNTGRGCNTYGQPYDPPERFTYMQIFSFDEERGRYSAAKGIEVDWGPAKDSAEFSEGMKNMRDTEEFKAYEKAMKERDPLWNWEDPADLTPWDKPAKVDPGVSGLSIVHPVDQHAALLNEWAAGPHKPWPAWEGDESIDPRAE
mmetsp:Transcript_22683/g.51867  ORF Transcript_22683/g.51867 Transcript_22683/m.51867 type:complete len:251 (+) Transcript_22683:149-901(+)